MSIMLSLQAVMKSVSMPIYMCVSLCVIYESGGRFGQTHPADGEKNNINLLFQSVLLYF